MLILILLVGGGVVKGVSSLPAGPGAWGWLRQILALLCEGYVKAVALSVSQSWPGWSLPTRETPDHSELGEVKWGPGVQAPLWVSVVTAHCSVHFLSGS